MMKRVVSGVLLGVLACGVGPAALAQTAPEPRYFYHGYSYGSDLTFHPVSELINGAFGIQQISSNWAPLDEVDFRQGLDVTWESLANPRRTVRAYGTEDFIRDEVVPGTFGWNNLQYVPNYFLHLMGGDPVKLGVVASLARPGGNMTGVSFLVRELAPKQIQLLRELVPKAAVMGFLVNPTNPDFLSATRAVQETATALRSTLVVVKARAASDFDPAFATLVQQRVAALFVDVDPLFADQRTKLAALAARHRLPAIYALREFVDAGGLMSYGTSITDANRQLGLLTGRVLKGTKPADLPVLQSTTFELVINLKAAKALGLTIPPSLLLRADQVIE